MKKAIVLLSGGLDSATCLYWIRSQGYRALALTFDYGQRHRREFRAAQDLARGLAVPCRVVRFSLPWKGSALLEASQRLPSHRDPIKMTTGGIPSTYVPARNTVFLSFAISYADAVRARAVVIGANAIDYSGYPDCRPNYLKAVEKVARLGTRSGSEGRPIRILAPLVRKTKSQIIRLGTRLGVPYEKTWSCYRGRGRPCGVCDSCLLRAKGFEGADLPDPLLKGTPYLSLLKSQTD